MVSEPVPLSGPGKSLGLVEGCPCTKKHFHSPSSSFLLSFFGHLFYFILFIIISATNTAIGPHCTIFSNGMSLKDWRATHTRFRYYSLYKSATGSRIPFSCIRQHQQNGPDLSLLGATSAH